MNLEDAETLGAQFMDLLVGTTQRMEFAGGIRRLKENPHDIEVVAIPKYADVEDPGRLVPETINLLEQRMRALLAANQIERDDPVTQTKNGMEIKIAAPFSEKYYRVKYCGEKVDLFVVTPPAQWGLVFTVRTGDNDFSHWLVQQGYPRGIHSQAGHLERWTLNGELVKSGHFSPEYTAETLDTPEEIDVFRILGIDWMDPPDRVGPHIATPEEWEKSAARIAGPDFFASAEKLRRRLEIQDMGERAISESRSDDADESGR